MFFYRIIFLFYSAIMGEKEGIIVKRCPKCGAVLGSVASYQKICPNCKTIYAGTKETCDRCHRPLAVYNGNFNAGRSSSSGGMGWAYILAVLIPLIGLIMGLIYLGREDDDTGKTLLITSIVAAVVWGIISACIFLL